MSARRRFARPHTRRFHLGAIAVSASLATCAIGCQPPPEPQRLTAQLDREGYALFEVVTQDSERVAILVEMRDAPAATYVLFHSRHAPQSTGWFALDVGAYEPCRRYGVDATTQVELDCLVPDGRGEVVDIVELGASMNAPFGPPRPSPTPTSTPKTTLLRHDIDRRGEGATSSSSSASASLATEHHFYALMRVEYGFLSPTPFAIEVRALDHQSDDESNQPSIRQIQ